MKSNSFTIYAPKACMADNTVAAVWLAIESGQISQLKLNPGAKQTKADIILAADHLLAPGLIDIFLHGALGVDVMDADHQALTTISRYLPQEGVTSFLATTMTAPVAAIDDALAVAGCYQQDDLGAQMLGIHLEGPFINSQKAGAQSMQDVLFPTVANWQRWQQLANNKIKIVTMAPEVTGGLELAELLAAQQVVAAMGHSSASFAQARQGIAAGMTMATHCYNAMSGLDHRQPGMVPAVLASAATYLQLIVDGVHLHPDTVRFTYELAGDQRIILASDAMRGKGMPSGCYELGGQNVAVDQQQARLVSNGALAGSVLRMDQAVRNMQAFSGCQPSVAVNMASKNPAELLGLKHKGRIALGADADLVVFDADMQVASTICRGVCCGRSLP